MVLGGKRPQMSRQLELPLAGRGEAPARERSEEAPTAINMAFPNRYFDELGIPRLAA